MDRKKNPPPQFGCANQSLRLPQEIIEEILTVLPVKSLMRFKCVSKPWSRLIGSDRFIKIHSQKSRDDRTFAHWRIIFRYSEPEPALKQCSKRSFMEESSVDPTPIEDPTNDNRPLQGSIVDSCNGVLCIRKKLEPFILLNPATRIFHKLPELDNANHCAYGFGWDETSDAFKVFVVMLDQHRNRSGKVYSTKTDSWKTVDEGIVASSMCSRKGKFVRGKIHWLTGGPYPRIESFDLKNEVFEVIGLPFKLVTQSWLTEKDGCLAVCSNNKERKSFNLWVMKEYGVEDSWVHESWLEPLTNITNSTSVQGTHSYYETLVSPVFAQADPEKNVEASHDKAAELLCKFLKFTRGLVCVLFCFPGTS